MWFVRLLSQDAAEAPLGPFTESAVHEWIADRRLSPLDFVLQAGDLNWQVAYERFQPFFNPQTEAPDPSGWVLTRPDPNGKDDPRAMLGPFSHEEVLRRIASGQTKFDDLAWRPGFASWQRIGDLPDFDRTEKVARVAYQVVPTRIEKLPVPDVPADRLLENVVRSRVPVEMKELFPEEACGEDLTGPPAWMKFAALLVCLAAASIFASPRARAAQVLEIVPLKLESDSPFLLLKTDAGAGEALVVSIKGSSGEILSRTSFAQQMSVRRQPNEVASLSLKPLKLPQGQYRAEARVGDVTAKSVFFIGRRDDTFQANLKEHQKQLAAEQQAEKFALFYAAGEMEKLARDVDDHAKRAVAKPASWRSYFGVWSTKIKALRKNFESEIEPKADRQAYPEEIAAFRQASDQLLKKAKSIGTALDQKRELASVGVGTGEEFRSLKTQAAALAGQP